MWPAIVVLALLAKVQAQAAQKAPASTSDLINGMASRSTQSSIASAPGSDALLSIGTNAIGTDAAAEEVANSIKELFGLPQEQVVAKRPQSALVQAASKEDAKVTMAVTPKEGTKTATQMAAVSSTAAKPEKPVVSPEEDANMAAKPAAVPVSLSATTLKPVKAKEQLKASTLKADGKAAATVALVSGSVAKSVTVATLKKAEKAAATVAVVSASVATPVKAATPKEVAKVAATVAVVSADDAKLVKAATAKKVDKAVATKVDGSASVAKPVVFQAMASKPRPALIAKATKLLSAHIPTEVAISAAKVASVPAVDAEATKVEPAAQEPDKQEAFVSKVVSVKPASTTAGVLKADTPKDSAGVTVVKLASSNSMNVPQEVVQVGRSLRARVSKHDVTVAVPEVAPAPASLSVPVLEVGTSPSPSLGVGVTDREAAAAPMSGAGGTRSRTAGEVEEEVAPAERDAADPPAPLTLTMVPQSIAQAPPEQAPLPALLTMTMFPSVARPFEPMKLHERTPQVGLLESIFGRISSLLGFGHASVAPKAVPLHTQTLIQYTPTPKQNVEDTAARVAEESREDVDIENMWVDYEDQDGANIEFAKREDRALRIDAETVKEKARRPNGDGRPNAAGSTHISQFFAGLAEQDGNIQAALNEDGDDLTHYSRLVQLQNAKVAKATRP